MKSITGSLDNKYSEPQKFDKSYNVMDHIDSSRSVEYQAIGSNIYSASEGARIVKFRLSDDRAWLDPRTVRIQYKVSNTAPVVVPPGGGQAPVLNLYPLKAHGWFNRMRTMSRSAVIEDIGEYNRVHEMFSNLKSDNDNNSEALEGFKNSPGLYMSVPSGTDDASFILGGFTKIAQGQSMVVSFAPFSGLFNQAHYIPLSFLPLEIEFELSTDPKGNIISATSGTYPANNGISEKWTLSDFKLLCDQKYYSPKANSEFIDMMTQNNGSYKIPINVFTSIYQTLLSTGPIDINISKSVHSLDRVYVSFFIPPEDATDLPNKLIKQVYLKQFNFFFSPAVLDDVLRYNPSTDIKRMGLKIGSLNFPDSPLDSNSLCYYYISKAHPRTTIALNEYHSTKFISLFNLERAGADMNTLARGIDTNNKNLSLTVEWPPVPPGGSSNPSYVHVVLMNELMINIFNTHVDILE